MTATADLESALRSAINSHAHWRLRLKIAAATRKSDMTPDQAARDDCCDFGKWLSRAGMGDELRQSAPYRTVHRLHADFHRVAGQALEGALNGQRRQADMAALTDFDGCADRLSKALNKWLAEVKSA